MAKKTLEKEMIPLVFKEMYTDCNWIYTRLDTGEIVKSEDAKILRPSLTIENVEYISSSLWGSIDKKPRIKMRPALKTANALELNKKTEREIGNGISLYSAKYYKVEKKKEELKE